MRSKTSQYSTLDALSQARYRARMHSSIMVGGIRTHSIDAAPLPTDGKKYRLSSRPGSGQQQNRQPGPLAGNMIAVCEALPMQSCRPRPAESPPEHLLGAAGSWSLRTSPQDAAGDFAPGSIQTLLRLRIAADLLAGGRNAGWNWPNPL